MQGNYFTNPVEFLLTTLISLYIIAVMLRFLFGVVQADFYNPVSQFLVRITNPLLTPLRKVIPNYQQYDLSAVVLMLVLQIISLYIALFLREMLIAPHLVILLAIAKLLTQAIDIFIFTIIVQVILSWVSPGSYSPVTSLLHSLTTPVLRPFQRMIPPVSGIDLSPLFALLALHVLKMLVLPLIS
jgi:YggT family protein